MFCKSQNVKWMSEFSTYRFITFFVSLTFQDFADPKELLMPSNTDKERLIQFTRSAVNYATDHELPEDLEFKQLSNGNPDIALFDFTSIKKASNASRIIERRKRKLLLALVGDSLIEVSNSV